MGLRHHLLPLAVPAVLAVFLLAPAVASADDDDAPPQGPPPAAYPQPLYPAPLSQTTQTTYVPQSVALSGPEEITDVEDDRRAPMGYTEVHRARRHLIVGGAVTFGVTYLVSAFTATLGQRSNGTNDLASLYVPVAGPFLELHQTDNATARFFLVSLGAAQLAGAVMLYIGVTSKQRVFVRNDLVGNLTITPLVDHHVQGLALTGSF